ncbi:cupin domain-containing protein [Streptomyces sp. NBC_00299]|nr:cupin domain-containing protein [Streptomyces sp. NBC_00299]
MTADPLSEALAVADARSVFSGGFTAGGTWAIRLRGRDKLKVIAVVRGSCLLVREGGGEALKLSEGDVVVSDGRRPYVLCSELGVEPRSPPRSAWTPSPARRGSVTARVRTSPASPGTST